MGKTLILKALLLICSLVIAGCNSGEWKGKSSKDKSKKQSKAKPVLVELAEVSIGPIEKILERSAPLEAEAQVQVNARTSNPAVDLLVEEGDKVKKGQILLRLENDRQKNDFDSAKSLLD
ncbi:MAG: biotin/lipoyl-binding protein, partial [Verrucomicrobiota bacterium]|nr:biotin/lipoyl-binding protein [Verrucomicrobiota bacterium]